MLVGVNSGDLKRFNESMLELSNLAEACNIETVGEVTQNLDHPSSRFYVGTGKLEEITDLVEDTDANIVIFNTELAPSQLRNLEKALEIKIIDRTMLILDIFASRAKTKEAQLQISIAQLQYFLPRLVGLRASLGRQSGGVGANRGAGEQKIELDRRKINDDITQLKKELKTVVLERQTQRKWRKKQGIKTVALVGYTNAGKSSIMNTFISMYHDDPSKEVFIKDMLFATLETAARRIDLPLHQSFLLTDTVGFVSNLPHHLVEAFKSTLEEISDADLLLHVVDVSSPEREQMQRVTNETLHSLGADKIPTIYLYNKADLLPEGKKGRLKLDDDTYFFSTKTKEGFEELVARIQKELFDDFHKYSLLVPYSRGDIAAYYHEHVEVLQESFENDGTRMYIYAAEAIANKFHKDIIEVKKMGD